MAGDSQILITFGGALYEALILVSARDSATSDRVNWIYASGSNHSIFTTVAFLLKDVLPSTIFLFSAPGV